MILYDPMVNSEGWYEVSQRMIDKNEVVAFVDWALCPAGLPRIPDYGGLGAKGANMIECDNNKVFIITSLDIPDNVDDTISHLRSV